ncbi:DUF5063 domain-containing protein [Thiococcus pfennigii]|uniref:DUF5063 domain-containing protein n=1 Tax=Thiococcus pfennigii TaxID=1057 RepID=UPI001F5B7FB8|nr:DUF5063 domain-containing protein [Thiococcus pfennigii]
MDHAVAAIAGLAARYCRAIEGSGTEPQRWLAEIAELLPRLHAALWSLDARDVPRRLWGEVDLDGRFELYAHLLTLLGERDGYWLEFDRLDGEQAMTGSLADDLTDIYCELKEGLALLAAAPQWAIHGWLTGYVHHWGQHLVDAQRHLAALSAQGRLD